MAVEDFLRIYRNSMLNKKIINPLSSSNTKIINSKLGINNPQRKIAAPTGFGDRVSDWLETRTSNALNTYLQNKGEKTAELASKYAEKAAGQVPTDEFGIVQDKLTDFSDFFNKQLNTIEDIGKAALAREQAKAEYQRLQQLAELNAGYQINWTPGASGDNPGAQAVSLAMNAYRNKVPYRWGGTDLNRGVDCSGLVQQVYARLGIKLPRTSYEQAKSGKRVSLSNLLPGDLVFYNTGSRDPNGIGSLSHVAIYIGNGQIIDARNSRTGITISSINVMGGPVLAVRPW